MSTTETPASDRAPQNRWTQQAASRLTSAYHLGGFEGAYQAFPEMDRSAVDAKLGALGVTALSADEKREVDLLLHGILKHRDPKKALAYARAQAGTMLSELNNPKRDRGDL